MDHPVNAGVDHTGAFVPATGHPGVIIAGRYKLLEEIGDGGMGTVWMAEQRDPVKRLVAVKLIKPGMDSRAVLARFEAERQALAMMDHPNIAKVLDGGTAEGGRPFFIMELVKGLPLTEYCDTRRLSINDRLHLFVQICSAVQHAHQKAVIHRDLKPSNVLVTEHDGKPVPKVIDFGLAEALSGTTTLTDRTLYTAYGTMVGTPLYMAPEQVGINALDVDTRTDVYALGVILYELLVGSTPLEKARFKETAWDEVKRLIREEEPPRPSTRLSSSANLPSLAASRQVEPAQLSRLVRGELDWIVMKALEKDRSRRYETANGLAMDVQRYLAGEPVLAVPPSASYRLRKFIRRHKGQVAAVSVVLLALVIGFVGTTIGMIEARQQRNAAEAAQQAEAEERARAVAERDQKETARRVADAAKKRADEEAAVAKAVTEFLQNNLLYQTDTRHQFADPSRLNLKPNITVRELLDRAASTVGEKFKGQPLVEAAIRFTIADTYAGMFLGDLALPHARRAVEIREDKLGPTHPDTLAAKCTLAFLVDGPDAEGLLKDVVRVYEATLSPDHDETLRAKYALAIAYAKQGKYPLSEGLYKDLIIKWKGRYGADSVGYLGPTFMLAGQYVVQVRDEEAEKRFREILDSPPCKDWASLTDGRGAAHALADLYILQERYELAEPLLKDLLAANVVAYGMDHQYSLIVQDMLDNVYLARGKNSEAESLARQFAESWKPKPGEDSRPYADGIAYLGRYLLLQKKWNDAKPLLRQCLDIRERKEPEHWTKFNAMSMLGEALMGQKNYPEAERLLKDGYEGMKRREARIQRPAKRRLQEAVERLVAFYDATDNKGEAARWRKEIETAKAFVQNAVEAYHPLALLRTGKTAEALALSAELARRTTWNSGQWYDFACIYAIASTRVAGKKQEYADRAMELLHKAVKAGYDDAAHLGWDPDLTSLRERDDFKKLLAKLTKVVPAKN